MTDLHAQTTETTAHKAYTASAETLRPVVDQLLAGMHQAVRGARGYVRDRPLTSVGIAVASGFLLSWALRQR